MALRQDSPWTSRAAGPGAPLERGRAVLDNNRYLVRTIQGYGAPAEEQAARKEPFHRTTFAVTQVHAWHRRRAR